MVMLTDGNEEVGLIQDPETGEWITEGELAIREAIREETRKKQIQPIVEPISDQEAYAAVQANQPVRGPASTVLGPAPVQQPAAQLTEPLPPTEQYLDTGTGYDPSYEEIFPEEQTVLAPEEVGVLPPEEEDPGILPPDPIEEDPGILPPEPILPPASEAEAKFLEENLALPGPDIEAIELEQEQTFARDLELAGEEISRSYLFQGDPEVARKVPKDRVILAPGLGVPLFVRADDGAEDLTALDNQVRSGLAAVGQEPQNVLLSALNQVDEEEQVLRQQQADFMAMLDVPAGMSLSVGGEHLGGDQLAFLKAAPHLLPKDGLTAGQALLRDYLVSMVDRDTYLKGKRAEFERYQQDRASLEAEGTEQAESRKAAREEAYRQAQANLFDGSTREDQLAQFAQAIRLGIVDQFPVEDISEAVKVMPGIVDLRKEERGDYLLTQAVQALREQDGPGIQAVRAAVEQTYGINPAVANSLLQPVQTIPEESTILGTDPAMDALSARVLLTQEQMRSTLMSAANLERDRLVDQFLARYPEEAGRSPDQIIEALAGFQAFGGSTDAASARAQLTEWPDSPNQVLENQVAAADFNAKAQAFLRDTPLPDQFRIEDSPSTTEWLLGAAGKALQAMGDVLGPVVDSPWIEKPAALLTMANPAVRGLVTHGDDVLRGVEYTGQVANGLATALFTGYVGGAMKGDNRLQTAAGLFDLTADALGTLPVVGGLFPGSELEVSRLPQARDELFSALGTRSPSDVFNLQRTSATTILYHSLRNDQNWQEMQTAIREGMPAERFDKLFTNPWLEFVGQAGTSLFLDPVVIGWRAAAIPLDAMQAGRRMAIGEQIRMIEQAARPELKATANDLYRFGEITRKYGPALNKVAEANPALNGNPWGLMDELIKNPSPYLADPNTANWMRRWVLDVPFTNRPEATVTTVADRDMYDFIRISGQFQGREMDDAARTIAAMATDFHTGKGGRLFGRIAAQEAIARRMPVSPEQVRPLPDAIQDSRFYLDGRRSAAAVRLQASRIADQAVGAVQTLLDRSFKTTDPMRRYLNKAQVPQMVDEAQRLTREIFIAKTLTGDAATAALGKWALDYGFLSSRSDHVNLKLMETVQAFGHAKIAEDALASLGTASKHEVLSVLNEGVARGLVERADAAGLRVPFTHVNLPNPLHLPDAFGRTVNLRLADGGSPEVRRILEEWKAKGRTADALQAASDSRIRELSRRAGVGTYRTASRDELLATLDGRRAFNRWRPAVELGSVYTPGEAGKWSRKLSYDQLTFPERVQNTVSSALSFGFLSTPRFFIRNALNNAFTIGLDGWAIKTPAGLPMSDFSISPLITGTGTGGIGGTGVQTGIDRLRRADPRAMELSVPDPRPADLTAIQRLREANGLDWYGQSQITGKVPAYVRHPISFLVNPASLSGTIEEAGHRFIQARAFPQAMQALNREAVQTFWNQADKAGLQVTGEMRKLVDTVVRSNNPVIVDRFISDLEAGQINRILTNEGLSQATAALLTPLGTQAYDEALSKASVREVRREVSRVVQTQVQSVQRQLRGAGFNDTAEAAESLRVAFEDAIYQAVSRGTPHEAAARLAQRDLATLLNLASADQEVLKTVRSWTDMAARPDAVFGWQTARAMAADLADTFRETKEGLYDALANTLRSYAGDGHEETIARVMDRLVAVKDEDASRQLMQSILMREFHGVNVPPQAILDNVPPHLNVNGQAVPIQRAPRPAQPVPALVHLNGDTHLVRAGRSEDLFKAMTAENQARWQSNHNDLDLEDPAARELVRRRALLSLPAAAPLGVYAAEEDGHTDLGPIPEEALVALSGIAMVGSLGDTDAIKVFLHQLKEYGTAGAKTRFLAAAKDSRLLPKALAGSISGREFFEGMRRLDVDDTVNDALDVMLKEMPKEPNSLKLQGPPINRPLKPAMTTDGHGNQVFLTSGDAALGIVNAGFKAADLEPLGTAAKAWTRMGETLSRSDLEGVLPEKLVTLLADAHYSVIQPDGSVDMPKALALSQAARDHLLRFEGNSNDRRLALLNGLALGQFRLESLSPRQVKYLDMIGARLPDGSLDQKQLEFTRRTLQAVVNTRTGPPTVKSPLGVGATRLQKQMHIAGRSGMPDIQKALRESPEVRQIVDAAITAEVSDLVEREASLSLQQYEALGSFAPGIKGGDPAIQQGGKVLGLELRDPVGEPLLSPSYESMLDEITESVLADMDPSVVRAVNQAINETMEQAWAKKEELAVLGERSDIKAVDAAEQWANEYLAAQGRPPIATGEIRKANGDPDNWARMRAIQAAVLESKGIEIKAVWKNKAGQKSPTLQALEQGRQADLTPMWGSGGFVEQLSQKSGLYMDREAFFREGKALQRAWNQIIREQARNTPDLVPGADRPLFEALLDYVDAKDALSTVKRDTPGYRDAYKAYAERRDLLDAMTGRDFRPDITELFEYGATRPDAGPINLTPPQTNQPDVMARWAADTVTNATVMGEAAHLEVASQVWTYVKEISEEQAYQSTLRLHELAPTGDRPSSNRVEGWKRTMANAELALEQIRGETGPRYYAGNQAIGVLTKDERKPLSRMDLEQAVTRESGGRQHPQTDWKLVLPAPAAKDHAVVMAMLNAVVEDQANWRFGNLPYGRGIEINIQDAQQLATFMGRLDATIQANNLEFLGLNIYAGTEEAGRQARDLGDEVGTFLDDDPQDSAQAGIRSVSRGALYREQFHLEDAPQPVWTAPIDSWPPEARSYVSPVHLIPGKERLPLGTAQLPSQPAISQPMTAVPGFEPENSLDYFYRQVEERSGLGAYLEKPGPPAPRFGGDFDIDRTPTGQMPATPLTFGGGRVPEAASQRPDSPELRMIPVTQAQDQVPVQTTSPQARLTAEPAPPGELLAQYPMRQNFSGFSRVDPNQSHLPPQQLAIQRSSQTQDQVAEQLQQSWARVYHGSASAVTGFDPGHESGYSWLGPLTFFSDNPEVASQYATRGDVGGVVPAEIQDLTLFDLDPLLARDPQAFRAGDFDALNPGIRQRVEQARQQGFDGVRYNGQYIDSDQPGTTYGVFPEALTKVRGAYDQQPLTQASAWIEGKTYREITEADAYLNGSLPDEVTETIRDLATDPAEIAALQYTADLHAVLEAALRVLQDQQPNQMKIVLPSLRNLLSESIVRTAGAAPGRSLGVETSSIRTNLDDILGPIQQRGSAHAAAQGSSARQAQIGQMMGNPDLQAVMSASTVPSLGTPDVPVQTLPADPGALEDGTITQRHALIQEAYRQAGIQLDPSLLQHAAGGTPWMGNFTHPSGPGTAIAQALGDIHHGAALQRNLSRMTDEVPIREGDLSIRGMPVGPLAADGSGNLPPNAKELVRLLGDFNGKQQANADLAAAVARRMSDYALHNYANRNDLDALLKMVIPWHFWTTRSVLKYGQRMAEQPWAFGGAARVFGLIDGFSGADGADIPDQTKDRLKGRLATMLPGWLEGALPGLKGAAIGSDIKRMFFPMDMLGFGEGPLTRGAGRQDDLYSQPKQNLTGFGELVTGIQQLTGSFTPLINYTIQDQWKGLLYTESYREYLNQRNKDTVSLFPAYQMWNRAALGFLRGQGIEVGPIGLTQTSARDFKTAEWMLYRWMAEGKISPGDTATEMQKLQAAWQKQSIWGGRLGVFGEVEVDGWAEQALQEGQRANFTLSDGFGAWTGIPLTAVLPGEILQQRLQGKLPADDLNRLVFDQYGTQAGDYFRYQWGQIVVDLDDEGTPITRKLAPDQLFDLVQQQAVRDVQKDPSRADQIAQDVESARTALDSQSGLSDEEWSRLLTGYAVGDKDKTGLLERFATDDYFRMMDAERARLLTNPLSTMNAPFGQDAVNRSKAINAWSSVREEKQAEARQAVFDRWGVHAQVPDGVDTLEEYYANLIREGITPDLFRDQDGVHNWDMRTSVKQSMLNLVPSALREQVTELLAGEQSVEEATRDAISEMFAPVREALKATAMMPPGKARDDAYQAVLSNMAITEDDVYQKVMAVHPEWDKAFIQYHLTNTEALSSEEEESILKGMRESGESRPGIKELPRALKDLYEAYDFEEDAKLLSGLTDRLRLFNGVVVDTGTPWTDINGQEHFPERNVDEYLEAKAVRDGMRTAREEQGDAYQSTRYTDPNMVKYEYFFGAGPVAAHLLEQIQAMQPAIDEGFKVGEARSAVYGRNATKIAANQEIAAYNDSVKGQRGPDGGYIPFKEFYSRAKGSFEEMPLYPQGFTELRHRYDTLKEMYDAVRYPAEYLAVILREGGQAKGLDPNVLPGPQINTNPNGLALGQQQDPSLAHRAAMSAFGETVGRDWRVNIGPEYEPGPDGTEVPTGAWTLTALRKEDYPEAGTPYVSETSSKGPSTRPATTQRFVEGGNRSRSPSSRSGYTPQGRTPGAARNPDSAIRGLLVTAREGEFLDNWDAVAGYVTSIYGGKVPENIQARLAEGRQAWPTPENTPDPDVRRIKQKEILQRVAGQSSSTSGTGATGTEYPRGRYLVTDANGTEKAVPFRMNDDPGEAVKGLLATAKQKDLLDNWSNVEDYVTALYGFYMPSELAKDPEARAMRDTRFRESWPDVAAILDLAKLSWPDTATGDEALRHGFQRQTLRTLVDNLRMKEGKNKLSEEQPPRTGPFVDPDPDSLPARLSHSFVGRNGDFKAVRDVVMGALGYPNLANTRKNAALPLADRQFLSAESWNAFKRAEPELAKLLQAAEEIYKNDPEGVTVSIINQVLGAKGLQPIDQLYGTPYTTNRQTYLNSQGGYRVGSGPTNSQELMEDAGRRRVSLSVQRAWDINKIQPIEDRTLVPRTAGWRESKKQRGFLPFGEDLMELFRYEEPTY